jgi:Phosphoglycerate dehydrogenase and related dehydrogenases
MKKILLTFAPSGDDKKQLEEIFFKYEVICDDSESLEALDEKTKMGIEVIVGWIPPIKLRYFPNLKWIQLPSAGTDGYTADVMGSVMLTNASGTYGHAISEYMVGAIFNIYKKFHLYRDLETLGEWNELEPVKSVAGSTVLSVGLGDIGGTFSKLMKLLGCKVIGVRKDINKSSNYLDEIVSIENIDSVIGRADIVAISVPGNEDTRGMFTREMFAKMKDKAVIINVGRGIVIDTEALCDALESGKLLGAVLDVTDPEPLPKNHRLYRIPSAVVTPHVSGRLRGMPETYGYFMAILLDNAKRYVAGEPLRNLVDMKTGYRMDTL